MRGDDEPRRDATLPGREAHAPFSGLPARFLHGDQELACWPGQGDVQLWDVADAAQPHLLGTLPSSWTVDVSVSPDSRTAVVLRSDAPPLSGLDYAEDASRADIWDISDRRDPRRLGAVPLDAAERVSGALFSPRGDVLALGANDRVTFWSMADLVRPRQLAGSAIPTASSSPGPMAFSPDGALFAASLYSGAVLWDVRDSAHPDQVSTIHNDGIGVVVDLAFTPDGGTLSLGGQGVALWNVTSSRTPASSGPLIGSGFGLAAAVSADSKTVAVARFSGTIVDAWDSSDPNTPRPLGVPIVPPGQYRIAGPRFSRPDGSS